MHGLVLKNKKIDHRLVLQLAIPMILSNISTPLLGLVDTVVLGHLDSEHYLGAVALGGLIFSFIFWGFGFLRMGTTGLTAQAFGRTHMEEINAVLIRATALAMMISVLILLLNQAIALVSFWLIQSSLEVENLASRYFNIRIWSTPATLTSYVITGWFIGQQNVKIPLLLVLITNSCNIGLDFLFVYQLKMTVEGVAWATVIAEYAGLLTGLLLICRTVLNQNQTWHWAALKNYGQIKDMLLINSHIFIRTWCVIFAFAFFTAQGARMGDVILAANAVLLNFQTFMAYALDGFAHAAEALVGKAVGAKNRGMYRQVVLTCAIWSYGVAIIFALIYQFMGVYIINLLTSLEHVRTIAYQYLPWLVAMPLVSFVCYLLDGVFIGAMLTKEMRNTMLLSLFGIFFPVWYFSLELGNQGLWLALICFMLARGLSMTVVFKRKPVLEKT